MAKNHRRSRPTLVLSKWIGKRKTMHAWMDEEENYMSYHVYADDAIFHAARTGIEEFDIISEEDHVEITVTIKEIRGL